MGSTYPTTAKGTCLICRAPKPSCSWLRDGCNGSNGGDGPPARSVRSPSMRRCVDGPSNNSDARANRWNSSGWRSSNVDAPRIGFAKNSTMRVPGPFTPTTITPRETLLSFGAFGAVRTWFAYAHGEVMAAMPRQVERRRGERRKPAGDCVDVTRLEHENLYGQVEEILRSLRRIENELHVYGDRIRALERDVETLIGRN